MKRTNIIGGGIILGLAGLILAAQWGSQDHTIRASAATVQQALRLALPKTVHNITVERDLSVEFQDGHAVITLNAVGQKLGKTFHLTGRVTGVPDQDHSKNGDFYLKSGKTEVIEFALDGTAPSKFLERAAERYAINHPNVQNALLDAAPHADEWMKRAAETAATTALNHIPIYRLKDDNVGYFMRAAVKDVRVEGDQLVVQFSLWQFTKVALVGLAAIALAIVGTGALLFL